MVTSDQNQKKNTKLENISNRHTYATLLNKMRKKIKIQEENRKIRKRKKEIKFHFSKFGRGKLLKIVNVFRDFIRSYANIKLASMSIYIIPCGSKQK